MACLHMAIDLYLHHACVFKRDSRPHCTLVVGPRTDRFFSLTRKAELAAALEDTQEGIPTIG